MAYDNAIYIKAGLKPIPLNLSPAMVNVLAAGLLKTNNIIQNLTMTTAIDAQQIFIRAADIAYMQVTSGTFSYDEAIKRSIKDVAGRGVSVINYASGRKDQIDVAMRRTVLTGVAQTTMELQLTQARMIGTDLVQTSAHIGARPTHQVWQGKIFSISGTNKKYPSLVYETGYGTVTGLGGINCRHSIYPVFEGLSENPYDKNTLKEYADKTIKYQGKDIPVYEATQIQRSIERKIRSYKRQASALKATGKSNIEEMSKVKRYQKQMREFIKETGLNRQYVREQTIE
jgi:SpoVK/Ycf46/Vps4 family AAA+-type ATPase